MIQGSIGSYAVPLGRTLAGFVAALLLAFMGDVLARVFNLVLGYPWPQEVHQNIHIVGIGLGAGIGAYLWWSNLSLRWYLILGFLLLVLGGSIAGAYIGSALGSGVDLTYWWSRYALDTTIHLGAAIGGIIVATTWGLINEVRATRRSKPPAWPIDRRDAPTSRYSDAK